MCALLLTWNPQRWDWHDHAQQASDVQRGASVDHDWSTGNTKAIGVGETVVLLRQGVNPKGIIASGVTTSSHHESPHYDPHRAAKGDVMNAVKVRFDRLLDSNSQKPLSTAVFAGTAASDVNWNTPASGIRIGPDACRVIEGAWIEYYRAYAELGSLFPEEVQLPVYEGATSHVIVNRYERSGRARDQCLAYYGYQCQACDLHFPDRYGVLGRQFMHVHHIVPLSAIGASYTVDPISDLRPLCPNCHAMVHRRSPPMTIDDLRRIVLEQSQMGR